mmetsp:Transcript_68674/g.223497  ORF Transcript_68674/g.223497 Transcript_68674/m.223497 type:complete len:353 (+) Transcript_68674:80-1138(+)|eukprot:CAMPEP_0203970438 /NCGR_PEP_ID=MMETSP0359-20131031/97966_1 /ASSEMBLY_ACC=CAM_ASM_000338 /TAXON_ID=268821 /ORGANISM="Scrippsiella Hangoei, Strain SHTV-5" /LENGTH=352 /DNA_ID=CAMNT_0050908393 /DNA_START=86 /DNA_END=1144 /DNA_ORIENTATION=+
MSLEELGFKVDQLSYTLDERKALHVETMKEMRAEITALRGKMREHLLRLTGPRERPPADSTFVRRVEWRISDVAKSAKTKLKNEAMWSDHFTVMGVKMQLEFFPNGRDSTWLEGFCALFLWCPAGVQLTYQLRVGNHTSAPDSDEFASRMGHGHSNFCYLDAQVDQSFDSVLVGVDILDIAVSEEIGDGVRLVNRGPESLVRRKVALITHRDLNCVEWRIRDILKRAREVPRGSAICSPPFALVGVPEMFLELYPNGVQAVGDDTDKEKQGYCGFYLRCPSGYSLTVTLFVGAAKKGPIKTDFGSDAAKGLPAFCKLEDQLKDGEEDLIVGVTVDNPSLKTDLKTDDLILVS